MEPHLLRPAEWAVRLRSIEMRPDAFRRVVAAVTKSTHFALTVASLAIFDLPF